MTETQTGAQERSVPKVTFTDAEAGAKTFPDSDARRYNYYVPAGRKQSHYEDMRGSRTSAVSCGSLC